MNERTESGGGGGKACEEDADEEEANGELHVASSDHVSEYLSRFLCVCWHELCKHNYDQHYFDFTTFFLFNYIFIHFFSTL